MADANEFQLSSAPDFLPEEKKGNTPNPIDSSLETPCLVFVKASLFWLVLGSFVAFLNAIQGVNGDFLANSPLTTYGRLQAVVETVMRYGWACNAAFALGLWVMARLSFQSVPGNRLLSLAGQFWNASIALAVVGILIGDASGLPGLQVPPYVIPLLLIALGLIVVWGILTFRFSQEKAIYVSQYYLLAAFFWFPWLLLIAAWMLFWFPVRGTVQTVVATWFAQNFLWLWLGSVALGVSYYLIPKAVKKPIAHYPFAIMAFWAFAIFASWAGFNRIVEGAIPAWISSTSIVAALLLMLPIWVIAINAIGTLRGSWKSIWENTTMRFLMVGILAFAILGAINGFVSLRSINEFLYATYFTRGIEQHLLYGFVSMILFAGIYFMLPYLTGRSWPLPGLAKVHWLFSFIGMKLLLITLYFGGWMQGSQLNALTDGKPTYEVQTVIEHTLPWLGLHAMAWGILLVAHIIFAVHTFQMLIPKADDKKAPVLPQPAT